MEQRILLVLINAITILLPVTSAEIEAEVAKETVELEEFMHRLKTALQIASPEEQCKVRAAFEMIVTDIEEMILRNPDGKISLLTCLLHLFQSHFNAYMLQLSQSSIATATNRSKLYRNDIAITIVIDELDVDCLTEPNRRSCCCFDKCV